MGYNDHLLDESGKIVTCCHCGKKYMQWTEEQVPGFRDKEYDYCPFCCEVNRSSMHLVFHNSKIEE